MNKKTVKEVCSIAFPVALEMAVYMTIMFFDLMMVGKYGGKTAVSAVGLSYEILYALTGIFIEVGICVGITSLISRKVGAGQYKSAEEFASIGFIIGVSMALVLSFITYKFSYGILSIAGAKGEVLSLGSSFMKILAFAIFFKISISTINAILRGYGNTKIPLVIAIVINIINLTLDFILIFGNFNGPKLGIMGAAIAAVIAQSIGVMISLFYIIFKSKIKVRIKYMLIPNLYKMKQLVFLSIPSSFEEAAFSLSRLLSLFIIMHAGTVAFSANQLATTVESISFMPGSGFGIAATALVGLNVGRNDYKGARESAYTCAFLGASLMLICSILFLTCPNFLINLFIKESETEVIRQGTFCLMIAAVEQPFIGISMIFAGALKGYGDTKTPFYISLFSSWVIRIPLMFYFIYFGRASVEYVWWITAIQWCFDGLVMFMFFEKKLIGLRQLFYRTR